MQFAEVLLRVPAGLRVGPMRWQDARRRMVTRARAAVWQMRNQQLCPSAQVPAAGSYENQYPETSQRASRAPETQQRPHYRDLCLVWKDGIMCTRIAKCTKREPFRECCDKCVRARGVVAHRCSSALPPPPVPWVCLEHPGTAWRALYTSTHQYRFPSDV